MFYLDKMERSRVMRSVIGVLKMDFYFSHGTILFDLQNLLKKSITILILFTI